MEKFIQIIKESKKVKTDFSINEMSLYRWSPRSYAKIPVKKEQLMAIFESARWSASAFNEQPWRFIIGLNGDDTFAKILDTLVEFNQNWAKNASALVLNIYKPNFTHNGKINDTAAYDLGQAVGSYCLEAVNQGLITHQMSGFDTYKANSTFNMGEEFLSMSITAIGHLAKPDDLPDDLLKIELQNRIRKPLNTLVFNDEIDKTPF